MATDRFKITLIANAMYEEEVAKKLGIDPHSEYGRKRLNKYFKELKKSDELSASIHLQNSNPGKFISYEEIRREAYRIKHKRLEPYVEKAKNQLKKISDVNNSQTDFQQEVKIDNQYITHKDSYTYREVLIGLRKEFLKFQRKLDQLGKYVIMFEDTTKMTQEKKDEYYFDLYKNPFENKGTELVLGRTIIRKRLLEKLGLSHSPTRAFMVKDNNGLYHPLRKDYFEKYQFNMVIKPGYEKEFQECAQEILNSDFAKYMMQLNGNIPSVTYVSTHERIPSLVPNTTSFGFALRTSNSQFKYLGRNNTLEFASVRMKGEKWKPLTQEHLDYISRIEFPKDAFSKYHQNIIEECIDDDRPIILSDEYHPQVLTKFEIQDTPKQLLLTKSQIKR